MAHLACGGTVALKSLPSDRPRFVSRMFGRIARRYDLGNRVLSLGRDQSWRRAAVRVLAPRPGCLVLDIGAGTADLSLELSKTAATVVAADFSLPMLEMGLNKVAGAGLSARVPLVGADAHHLPFPDSTFDAAATAFTVRNLGDIGRGLREVQRVLKPGGSFACLEFMRPPSAFLNVFYRPYLNHVLPVIGGFLTGDRSAYAYLAASINAFSTPRELTAMFQEVGFSQVHCRLLNFGTVAIHLARKG